MNLSPQVTASIKRAVFMLGSAAIPIVLALLTDLSMQTTGYAAVVFALGARVIEGIYDQTRSESGHLSRADVGYQDAIIGRSTKAGGGLGYFLASGASDKPVGAQSLSKEFTDLWKTIDPPDPTPDAVGYLNDGTPIHEYPDGTIWPVGAHVPIKGLDNPIPGVIPGDLPEIITSGPYQWSERFGEVIDPRAPEYRPTHDDLRASVEARSLPDTWENEGGSVGGVDLPQPDADDDTGRDSEAPDRTGGA